MSTTTTRVLRRDALFDLLASNLEGVTLEFICTELAINKHLATDAIHQLRMFCDESEDTINVVCDNDGIGPGIYRLVGKPEDMMEWYSQRTNDAESRLKTMRAVTSCIARGTDARTREGMKARRIRDGVETILRDLEWIDQISQH